MSTGRRPTRSEIPPVVSSAMITPNPYAAYANVSASGGNPPEFSESDVCRDGAPLVANVTPIAPPTVTYARQPAAVVVCSIVLVISPFACVIDLATSSGPRPYGGRR